MLNVNSELLSEVEQQIKAGALLTRQQAQELYRSADLIELGRLGFLQRQLSNPGKIVTFLVDRNINYTNVCNTSCSFCGFYRSSSSHPEAYVNSRDVIGAKIEEALAIGATRILMQGGHNDDLAYDYYLDLIHWIHSSYRIEINAFSPSEIDQMSRIAGKSTAQVLAELKQAGLAGLPGGGAEILDDEVRRRVSPKKISADRWIEVMEEAHSLGLTTTATMVIGFGEDIEQRLNHLERVRNLQTRSLQRGLRGFNAFISWTLQHDSNTSMGRSVRADQFGVPAPDYLRNLAVARIYLGNIQHHQASWPTMGPEIAQMGLHFGCDDIGSTMMEENVVSAAGAPSKGKWAMSPEELKNYIRGAGFIPAQRNSSYEIVQTFERVNYESAA